MSLDQDGANLGLPPVGDALDEAKRLDIYTFMRTCLELAVHVSPLVLLASMPYKGYAIDSCLLIQVRSPVCPPLANLTSCRHRSGGSRSDQNPHTFKRWRGRCGVS